MTSLVHDLNAQQKEAVFYAGRYLLILAGAGSGKTKTLISKIAYDLSHGMAPHSIIAVTFTNKAAKEMKERLEHVAGHSAARIAVGTFHRISHVFLRRYAQEVGLKPSFQIITPTEQKKIFKSLFGQLNFVEKDAFSHKHALGVLSSYYKTHLWPQDERWTALVQKYLEYLNTHDLLDFDGLIEKAVQLFESPFFHHADHIQLNHILVDEFQDTNPMQYRWIMALLKKGAKGTFVGDDDQSIYGFRGADVSIIRTLSLSLDNLWTIKLEQNYRSTPSILSLANAVISQNTNRLGKELWTANADSEKPFLKIYANEYEEAHGVCQQIHKLLHQGVLHSEIAVLYRSNALSRLFEGEARKYQWPYRVSGGMPFFEREEIRDIMSYLQVLVDRRQSLALERIINKPARKIGQKTQDIIQAYAAEHVLSYWDALLAVLPSLSASTQKALHALIDLLEYLENFMETLPICDFSTLIVSQTNLLSAYEKTDQGENKADNLYQLYLALRDYESGFQADEEAQIVSRRDKIGAFLSDYVLDDTSVQESEPVSFLTLSTCHGAKGLEWPYVFLIGLENNLFPHEQSLSNDDIEEERRLFYVAITRAKKKLYLSCAQQRQRYDRLIYNTITPFLKDLDSHYESFSSQKTSLAHAQRSIKNMDGGFQYTVLEHPYFGHGQIIACDPGADIISVRFARLGLKTFRYSLCKDFLR